MVSQTTFIKHISFFRSMEEVLVDLILKMDHLLLDQEDMLVG